MKSSANHKWINAFVIVAILIGVLACSLPQLKDSVQETQPAAGSIPEASELTGLSEKQRLLVEEFSWPHSFTIYEVDNESGAPVRYEIWNYYDGNAHTLFWMGFSSSTRPSKVLFPKTCSSPPTTPTSLRWA